MGIAAASSRPLAAQTPRSPEERASDLASQGVALFLDGRYRDALMRFLDSYAHAKIPEVVWNIGRCYEEIGDLGSALRYFEEFEPLAPDDGARRKARARIEQVRLRIAESGVPAAVETALVVSAEGLDVPQARIVVDGREVHAGPLPAKVPIAPGSHKVEVWGGEGVEKVSRTIEIAAGGLEVVVLRPPEAAGPEAPRMAGHATDRGYCDPFLFPSSRMGFAAGGEFSPVFSRGNPFKVLAQDMPTLPVADPFPDMPTQTFAGLFAQAGGDRFAVTLRGGRWSRVPSWLLYPKGAIPWRGALSWNLHQPFQRAGIEMKIRTSTSPVSWSTLVFDLDYRRFSVAGLSADSLQWLLAEAFGFTMADRVSLEFWLGIAFLVPEADESDGWKRWLAISFPMAGRVSVRVVPGGHVDLEARWPVSIGPMDPPWDSGASRGAGIQADMALGYRHLFGRFQAGGAVVFALNRWDDFGRERAWLVLSGQYQF